MNGSKKPHKIPSPLVSIVTPSYNSFPYIQETVESVQMQDYPHIEHIVIDGGSTDGTLEFLKQQDHLVWISEPDRGQSHALNKGFRRARGEIIGWLNADDTYQPGAVSTAVFCLLENDDIDMVHSDLQIMNEKSQPVGLTRAQPFDLTTHLFENHIKQPTVFMRRQVIQRLEGVDENLEYVMDRELWLRVAIAGFKMHYMENQVLSNFRLIPGTKSFEQTPGFRAEWLKVLENAFQAPAFGKIPPNVKKRAIRKTRAQYHLVHLTKAANSKDRLGLFQHFGKAIKHNPAVLANRSGWLILIKGLMGLEIDPLRRFKSNRSTMEDLS